MRLLVLALLLFATATAAADDERACAGVRCADRGVCFAERGIAHCLCEPGHAAVGHQCVDGGRDEEQATRARRDPGAGARVVVVAAEQVGRARHQIGAGRGRHPFALSRYLEPYEWWCGDFVAWVYEAAGVGMTGGAADGWLVGNNLAIRAWHERRARFVGREDPRWARFVPAPGDYVRFRTDRGGHAGIVERVDGDTLYTIEGNVGTQVARARYFHFRHDRRIDGFGVLALENASPEVDAGPDRERVRPGELTIGGRVEDDGPPERLRVRWTTVEGPDDPDCERTSAETTCFFAAAGTYVLRLSAHDGEHTASDDVRVVVRPNRAPALAFHVEELDAATRTARLVASVDDDEPVRLRWSVQGASPAASFDPPGAAETLLRFAEPGTYRVRLHADDGELTSTDELSLAVPDASPLGCSATSRGASPAPAGLLLLLGWTRHRRRSRPDAPSRHTW